MIRSLARRLVRHTLDVMPPAQRPWALGMTAELEHIEDDGAALAFALGAVWASYRQGARLWSTWLRLGRWCAALCAAVLGLGMFYMSVWLERVPEAYRPFVPFSVLMVLLGCCYLGASWGLAKRQGRLFAGLVVGISGLLAAAALASAASGEAASPWSAYAALLQGEPSPPHAYYAALLLEQFVFIAGLAAAGAFFCRFERTRAPA